MHVEITISVNVLSVSSKNCGKANWQNMQCG